MKEILLDADEPLKRTIVTVKKDPVMPSACCLRELKKVSRKYLRDYQKREKPKKKAAEKRKAEKRAAELRKLEKRTSPVSGFGRNVHRGGFKIGSCRKGTGRREQIRRSYSLLL